MPGPYATFEECVRAGEPPFAVCYLEHGLTPRRPVEISGEPGPERAVEVQTPVLDELRRFWRDLQAGDREAWRVAVNVAAGGILVIALFRALLR